MLLILTALFVIAIIVALVIGGIGVLITGGIGVLAALLDLVFGGFILLIPIAICKKRKKEKEEKKKEVD